MASAWGLSFGRAWGNAWGAISSGAGWYPEKKRKKYIVKDKIIHATPHELASYLKNLGIEPDEVKQTVRKPNKRALEVLDKSPVTEDWLGFQHLDITWIIFTRDTNPIDDAMMRQIQKYLLEQLEDEDDIECLMICA